MAQRIACRERCFAAYFSDFGHVRGIQLIDEPYSIRRINELKRVPDSPFPSPFFQWRRARSMVFGGKLEQTLKLPTVQTVLLWLVWVLRKKDGEGITLHCRSIDIWSMVWKKYFDCELFAHASFFLLQLSLCFCHCYQWKKCGFACKTSKNVVIGIFECFFLVRARARFVLATAVAKRYGKQLETFRVLLHTVMSTRETVGDHFWTHFV